MKIKDIVGNELNIGDKVAAVVGEDYQQYQSLKIGKVLNFDKDLVCVSYDLTSDWCLAAEQVLKL